MQALSQKKKKSQQLGILSFQKKRRQEKDFTLGEKTR